MPFQTASGRVVTISPEARAAAARRLLTPSSDLLSDDEQTIRTALLSARYAIKAHSALVLNEDLDDLPPDTLASWESKLLAALGALVAASPPPLSARLAFGV